MVLGVVGPEPEVRQGLAKLASRLSRWGNPPVPGLFLFGRGILDRFWLRLSRDGPFLAASFCLSLCFFSSSSFLFVFRCHSCSLRPFWPLWRWLLFFLLHSVVLFYVIHSFFNRLIQSLLSTRSAGQVQLQFTRHLEKDLDNRPIAN